MSGQRLYLRSGSALISTLLAVVVLTIIVTAFLQSMTTERQTARSYLQLQVARLAAESGVTQSAVLLGRQLSDSRYHYSISYRNAGTATETAELNVGVPVSDETNPPVLLSSGLAGDTTQIEVVNPGSEANDSSPFRTASWETLDDENGIEVARFAYWIDADSTKQNFGILSGLTDREQTEDLSELPVFSREGVKLTEKLTANFLTAQGRGDQTSSQILTPKTVNQFIDDGTTPVSEFDATLHSPSPLLTPEGNQKLNLTRLKRYVDGGTYLAVNRNGKEVFSEVYQQLPLEQGPSSERFLLIQDLLNEDGNHPADAENEWGWGNLEFIRTTLYPDVDATGNPTQARQIVANIIDYIDEDLIPTTDGSPGPPPNGAGTGISSANNPNGNHVLPLPPARPTVFGVEARYSEDVDGGEKEVRGHPFITYIGQGFIFNGNSGFSSSTRLLGWFGMGYPWAQRARITIGSDTRYQAELQFRLTGTVSGGNRGPDIQEDYILRSWLAQQSGYSANDAVRGLREYFEGRSYSLFPRSYHGQFDLANGFYTINQPGVEFKDMGAYPEVARLIYLLNGERYLIQEASMSSNMERAWTPNPFELKGGQHKLGFGWNQTDWHYQGDPRLNFRQSGWIRSTTSGFSTATGYAPTNDDMYQAQPNPKHDSLQDLDPKAGKWSRSEGTKNHFPDFTTGYEPSKPPGDVAMRSLSELGFIHAGAPWQTLTMFHDVDRYDASANPGSNDPYERADWRLLDYIELGNSPRTLNAFDQAEIDGPINLNTTKRASLAALFTDIDSLADPNPLIDSILADNDEPFLKESNLVDDELFFADGNSEFEKERLVGNVLSAVTKSSKTFTVYSVGEARKFGRTLSRVTLVTEMILDVETNGTNENITPRIIRQFIQ